MACVAQVKRGTQFRLSSVAYVQLVPSVDGAVCSCHTTKDPQGLSPGIKYFAGSKFFSSDLTLSWINLLVLFSQNRPASLLPHMGASLWYPAGQHVLFPDLSFRKKKSRDNLPVNFQYRAVLYKHTCNTRMKGRRTRRRCQGQLFLGY